MGLMWLGMCLDEGKPGRHSCWSAWLPVWQRLVLSCQQLFTPFFLSFYYSDASNSCNIWYLTGYIHRVLLSQIPLKRCLEKVQELSKSTEQGQGRGRAPESNVVQQCDTKANMLSGCAPINTNAHSMENLVWDALHSSGQFLCQEKGWKRRSYWMNGEKKSVWSQILRICPAVSSKTLRVHNYKSVDSEETQPG